MARVPLERAKYIGKGKNMKYYVVEFKHENESIVVRSEWNLNKGDIVLFNHWGDFQNAEVVEEVELLLGVTTYKNAPKVIKFIDIKEYNKENTKKTKAALLLSAMNDIEEEIKLREQRNKLAGKDDRYKELYSELEQLQEPIQVSNVKTDEIVKGEESVE